MVLGHKLCVLNTFMHVEVLVKHVKGSTCVLARNVCLNFRQVILKMDSVLHMLWPASLGLWLRPNIL